MACELESGEGAELPMGTLKSRGRNLTDDAVRRLRDMLYLILTRVAGMSVPDVDAIFSSHVSEQQLRSRLRRCPLTRQEAIRAMRSLLLTGGISDVS